MAVTDNQVITKAKQEWEGSGATAFRINRTVKLFTGTLYYIEIIDANGKIQNAVGYSTGNNVEIFDNLELLVEAVGPRTGFYNIMYAVFDTGTVAGFIAIIIVSSLCLVLIRDGSVTDAKIITALTLGLGSVTGFYFGRRPSEPPPIRRSSKKSK